MYFVVLDDSNIYICKYGKGIDMKVNEGNFVKYLIKKDERALTYVIKEYGWLIKTVVSKQLYNLKSVQGECINDIFLSIWNNIDKYDDKRGTFKNWVIGISKFKSIDYKRKYIKDINNEQYDSLELGVPDNSPEKILNEELKEDVENLLSCLNERDQDIFRKYFILEMNASEIAAELGVKTNVIYNRIYKGKKKIKGQNNLIVRGGQL